MAQLTVPEIIRLQWKEEFERKYDERMKTKEQKQ